MSGGQYVSVGFASSKRAAMRLDDALVGRVSDANRADIGGVDEDEVSEGVRGDTLDVADGRCGIFLRGVAVSFGNDCADVSDLLRVNVFSIRGRCVVLAEVRDEGGVLLDSDDGVLCGLCRVVCWSRRSYFAAYKDNFIALVNLAGAKFFSANRVIEYFGQLRYERVDVAVTIAFCFLVNQLDRRRRRTRFRL